MKNLFFAVACMLLHTYSYAQSVGIYNSNATPDPSALLDIASEEKGILIPRMTQEQRDAISHPTEGLTIYQLDNGLGYYVYQNNRWCSITNQSADDLLKFGAQGSSFDTEEVDNITETIYIDSTVVIYDSGGEFGDYDNSEDFQLDIYPNAFDGILGAQIAIEQTDLSGPTDRLWINDILYLDGETDTFFVSDTYINIRFQSNATTTNAGFKVKIDYTTISNSVNETLDNPTLSSWRYVPTKSAMMGGVLFDKVETDNVGDFSIQYGI